MKKGKIAIETKTVFLYQAVNVFISVFKSGFFTWRSMWIDSLLEPQVAVLQFLALPHCWLHCSVLEVAAWFNVSTCMYMTNVIQFKFIMCK